LQGVQLCCGLAFFGDSSMAVIVGSSEHALALDVAGNTFSETMKLPGEACAVAVSFDGRLVAVGLSNGSTVVLAADTNTIVAAFSSHAGCVFAVAFLGADRIVTCGFVVVFFSRSAMPKDKFFPGRTRSCRSARCRSRRKRLRYDWLIYDRTLIKRVALRCVSGIRL
jgi:hypothetical protein